MYLLYTFSCKLSQGWIFCMNFKFNLYKLLERIGYDIAAWRTLSKSWALDSRPALRRLARNCWGQWKGKLKFSIQWTIAGLSPNSYPCNIYIRESRYTEHHLHNLVTNRLTMFDTEFQQLKQCTVCDKSTAFSHQLWLVLRSGGVMINNSSTYNIGNGRDPSEYVNVHKYIYMYIILYVHVTCMHRCNISQWKHSLNSLTIESCLRYSCIASSGTLGSLLTSS